MVASHMGSDLLEPSAVCAAQAPALTPTMDDATAAAVRALGRTEDVMFSPGGALVAIVGHLANEILLLKVAITPQAGAAVRIDLSAPVRLASASMSYPHGVCWLTDDVIVVANRQGTACAFRLPPSMPQGLVDLEPAFIFGADDTSHVHTPGSVSTRQLAPNCWEVILCNNYAHQVSQHLIELHPSVRHVADSLLVQRGLEIPDGVAQSADGHWIAVSNHNEHAVRIYRNRPHLGPDSDPDALLVGVNFPHGLRFTPCGRHLVVADAGLPFVHVFDAADGNWSGTYSAPRSFKVVDDAAYWRGRHNPQEGGPKGIDFVPGHPILIVTNHEQPLAFFDLSAFLTPAVPLASPTGDDSNVISLSRHLRAQADQLQETRDAAAGLKTEWLATQKALNEQTDRLVVLSTRLDQCQRELDDMRSCRSWRITAPYRKVGVWARQWMARATRRPAI